MNRRRFLFGMAGLASASGLLPNHDALAAPPSSPGFRLVDVTAAPGCNSIITAALTAASSFPKHWAQDAHSSTTTAMDGRTFFSSTEWTGRGTNANAAH